MRIQGKHLDQYDRDRIKSLLDEGYKVSKIGRTLGIHHSTISREIKRNSYGKDERTPESKKDTYDSSTAQHKAYVRRKYSKYQGKKINEDERLKQHIIKQLKVHLNPEEISGHMKLHIYCSQSRCKEFDAGAGCSGGGMYTSKNTIYEWLETVQGQEHAKRLYSRRNGHSKKKKKTTAKRQMIPDRVSIDDRPISVANLTRYFHWEQDAVVSGKRTGSKAALSVLQERKTKYIHATVLPSMKPLEHVQATASFLDTFNAKALSITYDNGIENLYHGQLHALGVGTYFADPYSSFQKAMVENANKMIRRYYPKGTDFATVSQTELNMKIDIINKKPRKSLGFRSALQLALEKGVIGAGGAFGGGI